MISINSNVLLLRLREKTIYLWNINILHKFEWFLDHSVFEINFLGEEAVRGEIPR